MQIRLRTFAQVKELLGTDSIIECPPGSSVRWLLNAIRQGNPKAEDSLFTKDGDLKGHLILMLNSTRVYKEDIETLLLSDGDEVALFPPVSGG